MHDFDAIRWVTGREVREVYAVGANRGAEFFRAAGDVDTMAAVLTLGDDSLAVVSSTRGQSPAAMSDALEAFCIAEACELSRAWHEPVSAAEARR